jgi:hypothetical protein
MDQARNTTEIHLQVDPAVSIHPDRSSSAQRVRILQLKDDTVLSNIVAEIYLNIVYGSVLENTVYNTIVKY